MLNAECHNLVYIKFIVPSQLYSLSLQVYPCIFLGWFRSCYADPVHVFNLIFQRLPSIEKKGYYYSITDIAHHLH